jgi:hypothetical protein
MGTPNAGAVMIPGARQKNAGTKPAFSLATLQRVN